MKYLYSLLSIFPLIFLLSCQSPPPKPKKSTPKIQILTRSGEAVDISQHLIPGKYTAFEFYADW
ncbi:MAG: hypothetical protein D6805_05825 [Planctomycetota bacterium]|nr:MAG: hypothetical protein D6805_05825 [Planctomycetota bacterium]